LEFKVDERSAYLSLQGVESHVSEDVRVPFTSVRDSFLQSPLWHSFQRLLDEFRGSFVVLLPF
jgi:hypothetical protein